MHKDKTIKHEEGRKDDSEKTQYNLVPPFALEEIANVMTFGAKKYAPNNWKHVDNAKSRYTGAAMRHIEAYRQGVENDPETGLHHLAHASCCMMFLIELECKNVSGER